jgi:chloramphenicol-sensitive protein RarD
MPYALGSFLIGGMLPLYLRQLHHVPPLEFIGWRIVFTLPVCLALVALRGLGGELKAAIADPRIALLLLTSASLIAINWTIYVIAIQSGHVFAASLGYYIYPLVNVLAGTLFLGERLSRLQWTAVALAAAGISPLIWDALDTLGISLSLAVTFSAYGLVRKFAPVGALAGLAIESALLLPPAIAVLVWSAAGPAQSAFGHDVSSSALIMLSGPITAWALLLFVVAARRMSYSVLGFVQFLSPTLVFLLGLFVFHEPLRHAQLVSFIAIWTAVALFCWDMWVRRDLIRAA